MARSTVTLRVRFAWWLKLYLWGLKTACLVTGREPDWAKVNAMIERGVRLEQC